MPMPTELTLADLGLLDALLKPFRAHATQNAIPHLGGYSRPVTAVAEFVLNRRQFLGMKWQAVTGSFVHPKGPVGHNWLMGNTRETMLDLTPDQFGMLIPHFAKWPDANYAPKFVDIGDGARYEAKQWVAPVKTAFVASGLGWV